MTLSELSYSTDSEQLPISKVSKSIENYGIAVLPGYLKNLEQVKEEHRTLFEKKNNFNEINYSPGRAFYIEKKELGNPQLKNINATFSKNSMRKIATNYLGQKIQFNSVVVASHDYTPAKIIFNHYDLQYTFKFFLYLTDTDTSNGAFRFLPCSHIENRRKILDNLKNGTGIHHQNNRIEDSGDWLDICGPAGSLIIFDSAGYHSGGVIEKGKERKVLRSETFSLPRPQYEPKPKTYQWWLENRPDAKMSKRAYKSFEKSLLNPVSKL